VRGGRDSATSGVYGHADRLVDSQRDVGQGWRVVGRVGLGAASRAFGPADSGNRSERVPARSRRRPGTRTRSRKTRRRRPTQNWTCNWRNWKSRCSRTKRAARARLEVDAIERLIDDVNNEIRSAQANLMLRENERRGIEMLFKLGYAGKSERIASTTISCKPKANFATQVNRLKTQLATLTKLQTYDLNMQSLKLQGQVGDSSPQIGTDQSNNEALTPNPKPPWMPPIRRWRRRKNGCSVIEDQLTKCRIYAPQDGMVAYAISATGTAAKTSARVWRSASGNACSPCRI
jgi:hypothetical protein